MMSSSLAWLRDWGPARRKTRPRRAPGGPRKPAAGRGADQAAGRGHGWRIRPCPASGQATLPAMTSAQFLIDTSALARLMRPGAESFGWDQAVAAGLVAAAPSPSWSSSTAPDPLRIGKTRSGICGPPSAGWRSTTARTPAPGRYKATSPPWASRSAGPVDLVVAATAELLGLTLLHHDRDFATIAGVTGQALRWYGPDQERSRRSAARHRLGCRAAAGFATRGIQPEQNASSDHPVTDG